MNAWRTALAQRWTALQPRERRGLQLAAAVLAAALLWTQALGPALRTVRHAPAELARLEQQLQHMRALEAQVRALGQAPGGAPRGWREELAASVQALGPARLTDEPQGLRLTLEGSTAQALGTWLAELGPRWRLTVRQASLQRDAQGLWHGQLWLEAP